METIRMTTIRMTRKRSKDAARAAGPGAWILRLTALAAVWTFTAGATSCSSEDVGGPTFVTDLVTRNAAGAVDNQFARGEPVTFELSVRNRTRQEAVVQFSSGHQFDFVVVNDGTRNVRWKWSHGRAFLTIPTELEFAAGETKIFRVTWDQLDNDGQQVSAGEYESRGVMMFAQFATDPLYSSQLGSPIRPLTIL
jgi:hypothetical protein